MSVWCYAYEGYRPEEEGLREALCTLGNGYFATRGASPEAAADGVHYPGTYLAGGYNRLRTHIAGREAENEDLVNLPNWLPLNFRIQGGKWFSPENAQILSYRQELDLKNGVLRRTMRFRDGEGRETRLDYERLVHMKNLHLAAQKIILFPENWSGQVEFCSAIDGRVINGGVKRYRSLNSRHLEPVAAEGGDGFLHLEVRTVQSHLRVALSARTTVFAGGKPIEPATRTVKEPGYAAHHFDMEAVEKTEVVVEKVVALCTSRDKAISECGLEARQEVTRAGSFAELLETHRLAWKHLWRHFAVELDIEEPNKHDGQNLILHLYTFHLLQTTSFHTMDMDVGVPSRGWHGEAYRGHVFWDEIFIFPLLNLRLPEITRALLMYRYRRLKEARLAAKQEGFRGAMYPWQSGSDGREESQRIHLNPESGRWIPDNSHLQRHVNAAIAYNIWHYYEVTEDLEFLSFCGAEMFLEIARFWASLSIFNPEIDRYEILGVMGPDEYHDSYPGSDKPGLNNNAYTNIMAAWVLDKSKELLETLPEERHQQICEELGLTGEEIALWEKISRRLKVAFHGDGIISQFEGYDALEELDWEGYKEKYGDIQRLDRILESEGDTPNRYKASKQADVLMLFYLFSAEEIAELFERLGYGFEYETIPKNIEYYLQRTSHGSTLSRVVHSWVLARSDRSRSWSLFSEALQSDTADIQGGTTPEGIHLGAMAGTVDLIQRCYPDIDTRGHVLWFNPVLPEYLKRLRLLVRYRGHSLRVEITPDRLRIEAMAGRAMPIRVGVRARLFTLKTGEEKEMLL
jgi:alpha,alpha-trehalase